MGYYEVSLTPGNEEFLPSSKSSLYSVWVKLSGHPFPPLAFAAAKTNCGLWVWVLQPTTNVAKAKEHKCLYFWRPRGFFSWVTWWRPWHWFLRLLQFAAVKRSERPLGVSFGNKIVLSSGKGTMGIHLDGLSSTAMLLKLLKTKFYQCCTRNNPVGWC